MKLKDKNNYGKILRTWSKKFQCEDPSCCGGLIVGSKTGLITSIFPILNIFVSHVGQVPSTAGVPFLSTVGFALEISLLALHLTQYPIVMVPIDKILYYGL